MKAHTPSETAHEMRSRGFTLIELLTVIAIIGILAAIIIPTVGAVRSTAKNAKCISQVRQIGIAYLLYSGENKGIILDRGAGTAVRPWWLDALGNSNYLPKQDKKRTEDGIWFCPEAASSQFKTPGSEPPTSYGVCVPNGALEGKRQLSAIQKPSRTWMVGEVAAFYSATELFSNGWFEMPAPKAPFSATPASAVRGPGLRHSKNTKANVCMFDGHAEGLTLEQLNTQDTPGVFRYFDYP